MIKSNGAYVILDGTKSDLATELIGIIRALMEKDVLTREDVQECIHIAFMSDEEIHEAALGKLEEMIKMFKSQKGKDTFTSMFNDLLEDE